MGHYFKNNDEGSRCIHSSSDRNALPIITPLHGFEKVVAGPKNSEFPSCWNPKHTDQTKNFNTFNTEFPIPPINYTARQARSVQTKIKQKSRTHTDQTKNFNTFNTGFPIPPINYTARQARSVQTKIKQFHGPDIYQSYLWFTLRCKNSSQKVKWIWPYSCCTSC